MPDFGIVLEFLNVQVLLVVAGVSVLVTARPTEENSAGEPGLPTLVLEDTPLQLTQNGEGELDVGQNGEVNLQLADFVDPTESTPSPRYTHFKQIWNLLSTPVIP